MTTTKRTKVWRGKYWATAMGDVSGKYKGWPRVLFSAEWLHRKDLSNQNYTGRESEEKFFPVEVTIRPVRPIRRRGRR